MMNDNAAVMRWPAHIAENAMHAPAAEVTQMDTGSGALVLFFAVHWGILIGSVGKYRLFATHQIFRCGTCYRATLRLAVGFLVVNVGPILLLFTLYNRVVPQEAGILPIISAAVGSLSVYGFNRIVHAVVATERWHVVFYSAGEFSEVLKEWSRGEPNTFWPHFGPGLLYLVGFPLVAWLVGCM